MTRLLAVLLLIGSLASCVVTNDGRHNLDKHGVVLEGYDPVSYHRSGGPVPGSPDHQVQFDGATYWFASEETRTRFRQSPDYYVPLYGGWCAYAMADGDKVEIDPTCYLLGPDGLMLFFRSFLVDTRERWNEEGPEDLKRRADEAWAKLEAAARIQG